MYYLLIKFFVKNSTFAMTDNMIGGNYQILSEGGKLNCKTHP